jgi:hypothetical protein
MLPGMNTQNCEAQEADIVQMKMCLLHLLELNTHLQRERVSFIATLQSGPHLEAYRYPNTARGR